MTRETLLRYPLLLFNAYQLYTARQGIRMAAALAYYGLFAIVPLVIIVTWVASLVVGPDMAQGTLNEQLSMLVPESVASAITGLQQNILAYQSSSLTPIISAVLLIWAATTALAEMRNALNVLWGAPQGSRHPVWAVVRERALSLLGVLALSLLMLLSILLSAVLQVVDEHIESAWLTITEALGESSYLAQSLGPIGLQTTRQVLDLAQIATSVYGLSATLVVVLLLYMVLPDDRLAVGPAFVGASLATLLFWVGHWFLGFYFANSGRIATFGTATTMVVILIWAYYSAQMLYFGAAVAYTFANRDKQQGDDDTDTDEDADTESAVHGALA